MNNLLTFETYYLCVDLSRETFVTILYALTPRSTEAAL